MFLYCLLYAARNRNSDTCHFVLRENTRQNLITKERNKERRKDKTNQDKQSRQKQEERKKERNEDKKIKK